MIFIENKKKAKRIIEKLYPEAEIIDLTSKAPQPFVQLSPFFPHGDIPVPFFENTFSASVEGIWQGLKKFENEDIDLSKLSITDMKGLKRTVRRFGTPLGHRKGYEGEILDYLTARRQIYLPAYAWVLQNKAADVIQLLIRKAQVVDLVFLDYETNEDIEDATKPLSHASLVKKFIEKKNPELKHHRFSQVMETKPNKLKKPKKEKNKRGEKPQLGLDL